MIAEVKQETNKDGSGKGQMAAWKAGNVGFPSTIQFKNF